MTAPQPSTPEVTEFARDLLLQIGAPHGPIAVAITERSVAARDAALTAPLRAEVERLTRERDEAVQLVVGFHRSHGIAEEELKRADLLIARAEAESARLRAALMDAHGALAIVLDEFSSQHIDRVSRSAMGTQAAAARDAAAKALAPEGGKC